MLTYDVDPDMLHARLPRGLELDTRDGRAFVSVVAFDFQDTRVWGVSWPGYRNFPEINLRYYVRYGSQRGVCFIREFVGSRVVAGLARWIYNEPYRVARMSSSVEETKKNVTVSHRLEVGGREHTLTVVGAKAARMVDKTSLDHFFKEQRWGFGTDHQGHTLRYEVRHPTWEVYPVRSVELDWDWAGIYGPEWGVLESQDPYATTLAVGSEITLAPHGLLSE
jgi:uncharacterized protein YqjF (DUF2071 family)